MATAFLLDSSLGRAVRVDTVRTADHTDKPRLRGRLHQLSALASAPAGAHLVAGARPDLRIAALSYALTCTAMFATSATYHRLAASATARRRLRRADHSMIFIHIGGAATALSLPCLPAPVTVVLLAAVWSGIGAGVGLKVTRLAEGRPAGSWLYPALGLVLAGALPAFAARMTPGQLGLLVTSGLLYTTGGLLFFGKRPDPRPRVFGYHEVWHCFTVLAALCQYLLVRQLVG